MINIVNRDLVCTSQEAWCVSFKNNKLVKALWEGDCFL